MKICWIIGSVLLVLVVASLGILVPSCNRQISRLQDELATLEIKREVRLMNYQYLLSQRLIEGQRRIDIYLLKLLKEEKAIQSAEDNLTKQSVQCLSNLYTLLTDQVASAELKRKWATMSRQQLQSEVSKMEEQQQLSKLYDNIKKKNLELTEAEAFRMSVLVWTTIIQVVGLLMISISQYFREYAKQVAYNKHIQTD